MENQQNSLDSGSQHDRIRKLTFGAILIAISLVLGLTGWGFIPLPLPIAGATIFHIPVILAGILVGPEIGFLCGLVFGFFAFIRFPMFPWFVLIPARPLIGLVSYYVFSGTLKLFRHYQTNLKKYLILPSVLAGILGSFTNSIGTLGLGFIFKVFGKTLEANITGVVSALPVVFIEAGVAAILAPIIVIPLYNYLHPKEIKA